MNRKERIFEKINKELNPEFLEVENNSSLHKNHLGDDGSGETHYLVKVKSQKFQNISRIESHKIINEILKNEFQKGLHALEIKIIK